MERFIHNQNLALFRKKLADPQTTDAERETIRKLLENEESKEIRSTPPSNPKR